jgi:esterase/lipase superfamily enzyme
MNNHRSVEINIVVNMTKVEQILCARFPILNVMKNSFGSHLLLTSACAFAFGCAHGGRGEACTYAGMENLPANSAECVPPAPPPPPPPPLPIFAGGEPPIPDSVTTLRVHYATDRGRLPGDIVRYGRARGRLEYGVLDVSIPPGHRPGNLESPSWKRLEFHFDPRKHVMLHQVRPLSQAAMFGSLAEAVKGADSHELFVFVHGFNVSFDDAARRTAQIAFDLNLRIVPVMYSWPSQAQTWAYTVDEASIEKTLPNLRSFLEQVAAKSGATKIHLLAHSMGSRGLMRALEQISQSPRPVKFHNVILAAPDIDRDVFVEQIAPQLRRSVERVTLYASANDEALKASRKVHGAGRLGEAGARLTLLRGVETIDASRVDGDWLGHSYIAANKQVLDDLFSATVLDKAAPDRNLRRAVKSGLPYWILP